MFVQKKKNDFKVSQRTKIYLKHTHNIQRNNLCNNKDETYRCRDVCLSYYLCTTLNTHSMALSSSPWCYNQIHVGIYWSISPQSKTWLTSFSPRTFCVLQGQSPAENDLDLSVGNLSVWCAGGWLWSRSHERLRINASLFLSPGSLSWVTSLMLLWASQGMEYPKAKAIDHQVRVSYTSQCLKQDEFN